jgi:flagellar motor switch protein FliM
VRRYGRSEADVLTYDFRRPHRISKERLRTLEAMYERLCKSLEAWLVARVRGQVELRLQSVEQFSFGEFVLSLANPCATYIRRHRLLGRCAGGVRRRPRVRYFLVDRLFGGGGRGARCAGALSPVGAPARAHGRREAAADRGGGGPTTCR